MSTTPRSRHQKLLEPVEVRVGAGGHAGLEGLPGGPQLLVRPVRQRGGDLDEGREAFGAAGQGGHLGRMCRIGAGGAQGADQPVGVLQVLPSRDERVVGLVGGDRGVVQPLEELFGSGVHGL